MGASGVVNAVQGNISQQYCENMSTNNSHVNISNMNLSNHHMSTSNTVMNNGSTPGMTNVTHHQASSSSKSNLGQMEIEDECNANTVD